MVKALLCMYFLCVEKILATNVFAKSTADILPFSKELQNRLHSTENGTTISYECDPEKKMMTIEGTFVRSSHIRLSECQSIDLVLIRVFAVDTFFVDSDLYLNKTNEVTLHIFAYKWDVLQEATFYLNGVDGKSHPPLESEGAAGKHGNPGTNAGNFVGIANEGTNLDALTVKLNGGRGGDGQDGTGSDDVYVIFDEKFDSKGNTLSFQTRDNYVNSHYKRYFKERGYDAKLKETKGKHTQPGIPMIYTTWKVFTLFSQRCCGGTGAGGDGGRGGAHGVFTFLHSNGSAEIPKNSAVDGLNGKQGQTGRNCCTFDLEVDIETKLTIYIGYILNSTFHNRPVKNTKCFNEIVYPD
ncbi:uncharacterized protein LOC116341698 [Contarinia nasturtii]|uniref:uncharacterized protein LOC116341698 n=1 Tax=Contarinia nasturtii TaxID=265458 RepID=UPI0012D3E5DB|nr:uncharacterized protein LOC116341698 [Contarinia nasturtii]